MGIPEALEAEKAYGHHYDTCQQCRAEKPCLDGLKLCDATFAIYDAIAIAGLDAATCQKELDMLPNPSSCRYPPGIERTKNMLLARIRQLSGQKQAIHVRSLEDDQRPLCDSATFAACDLQLTLAAAEMVANGTPGASVCPSCRVAYLRQIPDGRAPRRGARQGPAKNAPFA